MKTFEEVLRKDKSNEILKKLAASSTDNKKDNFKTDPRRFKIDSNGHAVNPPVIRFLPQSKDDVGDLPYVIYAQHYVSKNGKKFPVNCPKNINNPCPFCERGVKKSLAYLANIYVVEDAVNQNNIGKVMLYQFYAAIHEKIVVAANRGFKMNVFDFMTGANFMIIPKVDNSVIKYDNSMFLRPEPLHENVEEMEKIWNRQFSLDKILKEMPYKPYPELLELLGELPTNNNTVVETLQNTVNRIVPEPVKNTLNNPPVIEAVNEKGKYRAILDEKFDDDIPF